MGVERLAAVEFAKLVMREPVKYGGEKITPMLCNGVTRTASQLIRKYNCA